MRNFLAHVAEHLAGYGVESGRRLAGELPEHHAVGAAGGELVEVGTGRGAGPGAVVEGAEIEGAITGLSRVSAGIGSENRVADEGDPGSRATALGTGIGWIIEVPVAEKIRTASRGDKESSNEEKVASDRCASPGRGWVYHQGE